MPELDRILNDYRNLLSGVDGWYADCLRAGGAMLACREGCSGCCRGLFDITLLDAWLLKAAFAGLPAGVRAQVLERCRPRVGELSGRWPGLRNPYLLNDFPEAEWAAMPEEDDTPCPLLDESGRCLVYAARPLTCRLHGLPNIDVDGTDFDGTVCTLHPGDPGTLPGEVLRWRFRELFVREGQLCRALTRQLTGTSLNDLDTFIPLALLADYATVDWRALTPVAGGSAG